MTHRISLADRIDKQLRDGAPGITLALDRDAADRLARDLRLAQFFEGDQAYRRAELRGQG